MLAANKVNLEGSTALADPGTDEFLRQYFSGSLIGLPDSSRGTNTLRPKFSDVQVPPGDYVSHQRQLLWANGYSRNGYRDMINRGELLSNGRFFFN